MIQRFQRLTLERQLFVSFFSLCAALLLLFTGITLWLDISRQRHSMDGVISNTAAYVASLRRWPTCWSRAIPTPRSARSWTP